MLRVCRNGLGAIRTNLVLSDVTGMNNLVPALNVAVIPARGGSKRIPKKNIKLFCGKPMIAWSITAARQSGLFSRILVSTDDPEIADIAKAWGAEVPFIRPAALANDTAATQPVIAHALQWCKTQDLAPQHVCCIYPCAPLLEPRDLIAGLALLVSSNAGFVYPVTEFAHPVQRALRRLPDGHMQFLEPGNELARTQDLETTYHDCGQFYWGTATAWLGQQPMHSSGIGLPIPHWRVVDIDNEDDWRRAEQLFVLMGKHVGTAGANPGPKG